MCGQRPGTANHGQLEQAHANMQQPRPEGKSKSGWLLLFTHTRAWNLVLLYVPRPVAWRLHPCLSIGTEHLRLALLWAVCPP